jgi:small subunit ribosomal protein S1
MDDREETAPTTSSGTATEAMSASPADAERVGSAQGAMGDQAETGVSSADHGGSDHGGSEAAAGETDPANGLGGQGRPDPPPVPTEEPPPAPEQEPAAGRAEEAVPEAGEGRSSKGTREAKQPTSILEGEVTAVSAEEVELTLDDGRPAVINRRNFGPGSETPDQLLSIGDRAFGAELQRDDPRGRVVLSRAWALKKKVWDEVVEAASRNSTLTGTVTSAGSKGLVVDVGVRGFVPSSHLELEPVSDLQPYVGQCLELRVLEADPRRERLVLSRRTLLLKEQRRRAQEKLASLEAGMVCTGTVTSLTNYGAFVDIGGVNGLVHLSELSWTRVRRPADVVSIGDQVEVKVLDVKAKKRRVSLSIRRLTPDPLSQLEVGAIQAGPVTRLVDFGAFVSLGEVEGLVHLSEMAEYRVSTPEEIVAPGEEVWVKILSVDTKRRRVELSIRRAAEYG